MLPRHSVYRKLDSPVTVLGVDLEDWFGLGVAFIILSRASDLIVGQVLRAPRAEAAATALATGVVFLFWRRLRDRTPRHFLRHLLTYLAEPDAYIVLPDQDVNPYVV
jgi:hypothetical protein